jgi:hypothetical protein
MLTVLAITSGAAACGPDAGTPEVITVEPGRSIQDAVDDAAPGDLVLIEPGTYHESVEVDVEDIVLRGLDRNEVVLDGRLDLENGITVRADGVAVENLTVRGYRANGVVFVGALDQRGAAGDSYGAAEASEQLRGYRASYVTAHDNGLYGLYAFAAERGVFEHSYVEGNGDAGVYIGQCRPCDALVRDVTGERNAVGYQAINASGVTVVESVWRGNRVGIEVGSQDVERLAPQSGHVIAGNLVVDNDDAGAPGDPSLGFGVGIVVVGGTDDDVERNRIGGHDVAGIVVTDGDGFPPLRNTVAANVLVDNTVDLVFALSDDASGDTGSNCFRDNEASTALPPDLLADPCSGGTAAAPPLDGSSPPTVAVVVDDVPMLPGMPDPTATTWQSAADLDLVVDTAVITVPT